MQKNEEKEREEMSREQELEYVDRCFDEYEKEGFSKVFISPYTLGGDIDRNGSKIEVLGRVMPVTEKYHGEGTAVLEALPMWRIQFRDGEILNALPEEIIPSEIQENISMHDRQYLKLM